MMATRDRGPDAVDHVPAPQLRRGRRHAHEPAGGVVEDAAPARIGRAAPAGEQELRCQAADRFRVGVGCFRLPGGTLDGPGRRIQTRIRGVSTRRTGRRRGGLLRRRLLPRDSGRRLGGFGGWLLRRGRRGRRVRRRHIGARGPVRIGSCLVRRGVAGARGTVPRGSVVAAGVGIGPAIRVGSVRIRWPIRVCRIVVLCRSVWIGGAVGVGPAIRLGPEAVARA